MAIADLDFYDLVTATVDTLPSHTADGTQAPQLVASVIISTSHESPRVIVTIKEAAGTRQGTELTRAYRVAMVGAGLRAL